MTKPVKQGRYDALCGAYAAINALRILCPELKHTAARRIFAKMIREAASGRSDPLQILWRGMDGSLVRNALKIGMAEVRLLHGVQLELSKLPERGPSSIDVVLEALHSRINRATVALLLIRAESAHWTVAYKLSGTKLHLRDSGKRKYLRLDRCTTLRDDKELIRIHAQELTFLTRPMPDR